MLVVDVNKSVFFYPFSLDQVYGLTYIGGSVCTQMIVRDRYRGADYALGLGQA
jgi:hypothetical protein